MAPFVGRSGVVMSLAPLTSAGLVRKGKIVEIPEGISTEEVAGIVKERFGAETKVPVAKVQEQKPVEKPRGNASREDWVAYALSQGKTEDDVAGLKQSEIRALFEDKAEGAQDPEGATNPQSHDKGDSGKEPAGDTNPDPSNPSTGE